MDASIDCFDLLLFSPPVLKIKLISCITQGGCFETCVVCNQGCGTSPPPKKKKKDISEELGIEP